MTDLSPEYQQAIANHNVALRAYATVLEQYRAGKMSDAEYLKHRITKVAADAEFDTAFAAEAAS